MRLKTKTKYFCMEPELLIKKALEFGFLHSDTNTIVDEYFTDIDGSYINNEYYIKIRKYDEKNIEFDFNENPNSLSNFTYLSKSDFFVSLHNYDDYVNYLSSCDYYSYVTVNIERNTYKYNKSFFEYKIVIDNIKNIGGFLEFQIISLEDNYDIEKLKKMLDKFVFGFSIFRIKPINLCYRDIVVDNLYKKVILSKKTRDIYINLDNQLICYEKDFYKKCKDKIAHLYGKNIRWGIYKKDESIDELLDDLVVEYLDNNVSIKKDFVTMSILLRNIKYNIHFITTLNKLFFVKLLKKLEIDYDTSIFIDKSNKNQSLKSFDLKKNIVLNEKNLKQVNSMLFIIFNKNK